MASANSFGSRVSWIRKLGDVYPYIDLERVGIVGCEGSMGPLYGLLERPDFYKVGVVINLEDARTTMASVGESFEDPSLLDKTIYAEDIIESLRCNLVLIHGMLDSVAPVGAVMRVIDALQTANKDFDLLLLPCDGHFTSSYARRRIWDYLIDNLIENGDSIDK